MSVSLKKSPTAPDGKPYTVNYPTKGSGKPTHITHRLNDKTTWFANSVYVEDEVATDTGDHLTYDLVNDFVIDTYHWKLFGERYMLDSLGRTYRVAVTVNDVAKTEQDPHLASGGDYTINYVTGAITFLSVLDGSDVVKVTYHYATTSEWYLPVPYGKILQIVKVQAQFSNPIDQKDAVVFSGELNADIVAPGSFPPGTWIPDPTGDPVIYNTMYDFIGEADTNFPEIPTMGGTTRGLTSPVHTYMWNYTSMTEIPFYARMVVKLEHDIPFVGDYVTAAFYTLSETVT